MKEWNGTWKCIILGGIVGGGDMNLLYGKFDGSLNIFLCTLYLFHNRKGINI
jgi:hypothetical protein